MSATSTCPTPTASAHFRMLSSRATRRLALSSFESFRLASEKSRGRITAAPTTARPRHLHRPRRRQRPTQSPVAENAAQIMGLPRPHPFSTNTPKLFLPQLEHLQKLFAKHIGQPKTTAFLARSGRLSSILRSQPARILLAPSPKVTVLLKPSTGARSRPICICSRSAPAPDRWRPARQYDNS